MRKAEMLTETEILSICDGCRLIPVSHLGLDIAEPIGGFRSMLDRNAIEVVTDDLGRDAITREALGQLLAERREREARLAAEAKKRRAETKPKPVFVGAPGRDDMTPAEAMFAAEGDSYTTPESEFGRPGAGTVMQELMDAQFTEARRRDAERRARKERRAKEDRK